MQSKGSDQQNLMGHRLCA